MAAPKTNAAGRSHAPQLPAGPVRHAISIPVHEAPAIIAEQCRNFELFAPQALIMLHVSTGATFSPAALADELTFAGTTRTLINPQSVPTRWGQILPAHLANIRALAPYCDALTTVSINASNDMLLAPLPEMGVAGLALFERREISPSAVWVMARQWSADSRLAPLLAALDCPKPVGGQVEGVSLPYSLMAELADRLEAVPDVLENLPPIAEELVFSTMAAARLGKPSGQPYIWFRKHTIPGLSNYVVPRPLRGTPIGRAVVGIGNRISSRVDPSEGSFRDFRRIADGQPLAPGWRWMGFPPAPPTRYYGIKRVDRRADSPLRQAIAAYTETRRGAQMETWQ